MSITYGIGRWGNQRDNKCRMLASLAGSAEEIQCPVLAQIQLLRVFAICKRLELFIGALNFCPFSRANGCPEL